MAVKIQAEVFCVVTRRLIRTVTSFTSVFKIVVTSVFVCKNSNMASSKTCTNSHPYKPRCTTIVLCSLIFCVFR
jgi:hypothetical protein